MAAAAAVAGGCRGAGARTGKTTVTAGWPLDVGGGGGGGSARCPRLSISQSATNQAHRSSDRLIMTSSLCQCHGAHIDQSGWQAEGRAESGRVKTAEAGGRQGERGLSHIFPSLQLGRTSRLPAPSPFSRNQGRMRSIATVTISMTTLSPLLLLGPSSRRRSRALWDAKTEIAALYPKPIRRIIWYYIRKDSCKIHSCNFFFFGGGGGVRGALPPVSIVKLSSEVRMAERSAEDVQGKKKKPWCKLLFLLLVTRNHCKQEEVQ